MLAQTSFTKNTTAMDLQNFHSGVAIAVVDVNGDGRDDVAHLSQGTDLFIEYQQTDGSFVTQYVGPMSSSSEWMICAGDADNNGITDFFTGGAYNDIKLAMANQDGSNYSIAPLPGPGLFAQGSNFADINNDGWLDVFVCHDDGESRIWGNDGTGNFVQEDSWINMDVTSTDDSGNYGSVWCDFDNDGDTDLYIAKCRQGVTDPNDGRRVNVLYVNDGNGNFTEEAAARGLVLGAQSWTADFADYDNDGDFDCFVTNHDTPSQLLRNDNGYFTDVTPGSGINISTTPIQGIMEDFDNDGFVDLLIAGGDEQFFHNNGDGTFTELFDLFDNNDMESYGIGDLNHDGLLDIYAGYASIFTSPSNVDDALWINTGNGTEQNNFISVNLQGTISNRSGIGARVEIHGDWGIQIREVRAGESYGIVNSFNQHFGIGQSTTIDQIVVKWPSGIVDVVDNPAPNQFITLIENNCVALDATIVPDGGVTAICAGDNLGLTGPAGYSYSWSTGDTGQSITVNNTGSYTLTITDGTGCIGVSSISITANPDETPSLSVQGDLSFCEGGSVMLTSSDANGYAWSNGETSQTITVTQGGSYEVTTQGTCDNFTSESVLVEVLSAAAPTANGLTINSPQSVVLTAVGENPTWYDVETGGTPLATGTSFTTPVLSSTTTYYVDATHEYGGMEANTGLTDHSGPEFSGGQFNGQIIFDVTTEFVLKTVKVYADIPGDRIIELWDNTGTVLESKTVNITGDQVVALDFNIMPGTNYVLTTNTTHNNNTFGDNSPELRRNNEGVSYPYVVPDVVSLNASNYDSPAASYYYYFYDWKIELPSEDCVSERVPVLVDYVTGITQLNETESIKMYPNPTSGSVNLEMDFDGSKEVSVSISDLAGKNIANISLGTINGQTIKNIDLTGLAQGTYTVKIKTDSESFISKLVIQ